jgi:FAD/FMN-containing dehydrogenase
VRACREFGHPFVPRGAGTGLSGGAHPSENSVVIECSRMKSIVSVDAEDRVAVVQPGVVNADLSTAVAKHGLFYAPDPSSQQVCTIGGNVAENSGGPHTLKYGTTTNHVLSVELVLPDGEIVRVGSPTGFGAHSRARRNTARDLSRHRFRLPLRWRDHPQRPGAGGTRDRRPTHDHRGRRQHLRRRSAA